MAKSPSPPPEVELHFILPVISGLRKIGTVIAKQGDASVMHEFEYTDANDLTATIIGITRALTDRKNELKAAATAAKAAAKPASVSPSNSDDARPDTDTEADAESADDRSDENEANNDAADDLLTTIGGTTAVHRNDALDATSVTDKRGQLSFM